MKRIILAMAFIATLSAFGQTTMQEYNYMTTGYQLQVKSGQDINKGYRVERIGKFAVDLSVTPKAQRISEFFTVYSENSAKPLEPIGTLVKMYKTSVANDVYFFMPNRYSSSEVFAKAIDDYTKTFKGDEVIVNYTWNMMRMISVLTTK